MNRRKFIVGLLSAVTAFCGFKFVNKKILSNDPWLRHVEIHLVEHCNLNCKYCSHFSSIAKKEFYNLNEFKKDMARLAKVTNKKIKNIQLLGGEPLLHPNINEMMKFVRRKFPYTCIDILTNGILLENIDEDFYKTCKNFKINIKPSIYPIKISWDKIFKKAAKYDLKLKVDKKDSPDLILKDISWRMKEAKFYKVKLDLDGKMDFKNRYKNCHAKINCLNFVHGKIYPCFIASNIRHFNSKFNKNLIVDSGDYLNIYKIDNINEIFDFLEKPKKFCRYCNYSSDRKYPWEIGTQDISEWS